MYNLTRGDTAMHCKEIFDVIDELYPKYLAFWEDVCNIESPTADKISVDEVGKCFLDWAKVIGFKTEVFEHGQVGNVVSITINSEKNAAPLTLSGHMDTVHPKGIFGYPPVRIDGDKIYGPGVTDCKGGIVAAALAMEALAKCGFNARPVRLLLQSDEENGSKISKKATINHMCEKSKDSVAFINLEGYDAGQICTRRKGIITFKFAITGIEAHSSMCAVSGANAIADAAHKIIEMEKLKDDAGLTCNVGVISGGSVPNTVAGRCEFCANVRFATSEQLQYAKEYAKKVAETVHVDGCRCEISVYGSRPAMEQSDKNDELFEKINEAFKENGLPVLRAGSKRGGSDAAEITIAGIPCVDSLGVEGGRIHSEEEFAFLSSLCDSAKRMAAIAMCIKG